MRFRFDLPLETAPLRFLRWVGEDIVEVTPPAIGDTLHIQAQRILPF